MKHSPRRQIWMIMIIVFLGFVGLSMPYLIFPVIFLNPEYSIIPAEWTIADRSILLGITLAAYPIGQFIGSPVLGALSDDYGRRKIMSSSLLVTGVCSVLTGLSLEWNFISLLIISRFFAGLMEGNIAIARAMAADIKELSKHDTLGKVNAAASTAYIIGPLLGGLVSDQEIYSGFTVSTPFYLIAVLFISQSFLSKYLVEGRPKSILSAHRTFYQRINIFRRVSLLFKDPQLKFYLITTTIFILSVDMFFEFGPAFLTMLWNASPSDLAFYNGFLAISISIGSGYLTGKLATRYSSRQMITSSIIGYAVTITLIALTGSHMFMLLFYTLIGFCIAVGSTILTVQISDSATEDVQGEVMGVQTSLRVLGDAIICLLGGVLLIFSAKLIMFLAASIALIALLRFKRCKGEGMQIHNDRRL